MTQDRCYTTAAPPKLPEGKVQISIYISAGTGRGSAKFDGLIDKVAAARIFSEALTEHAKEEK